MRRTPVAVAAVAVLMGCEDEIAAPPPETETALPEMAAENPDRATLVALYEATGGPNWKRRDNWLTDAPLAEWRGVEVDSAGRVESLYLNNNNLAGRIPPELDRLSALRKLWLAENRLTGAIPSELGNLASLEVLSLGYSGLSGPIPPELGNLVSLKHLSLMHSSASHRGGHFPPTPGLSGPIPPELGNLAALESLDLNDNWLTGPIPPALGNISGLRRLNLSDNDLTGSLPLELGNLSALVELSLDQNNLTGPIPPELGRLATLGGLRLSDNEGLSGPLPAAVTTWENMTRLHIGDTALCVPGTLDFWTWRENLSEFSGEWCNETDRAALEDLYEIAGGPGWTRSDGWLGATPVLAHWHGVATDSLGQVTGIALPANGLAGGVAPVAALSRLKALDIEANPRLQGPLPLALTRMALDTLRFSGTGLCIYPETREWLESILVARGTGDTCKPLPDRDVLVTLYEAMDGANWHFNDNWLTDAPLSQWHGVGVNDEGRVLWLHLGSGSNLSGPIPPELGSLDALESLILGGDGPIPPELGRLTALKRLRLVGFLTGSVPPELGRLSALERLSLEGTALSGPIPSELANLTALTVLNLAYNDLSGPIPPELGGLADLGFLALNNNSLSGPVPPEVGNLTELWSLSLYGNAGLSGPLPSTLTALKQLRRFTAMNTDLCAPADLGFRRWLEALPSHWIRRCEATAAYLVQTTRRRGYPVPLVAGREALLRVFPIAPPGRNGIPVPPMRASFYAGAAEVYTVDVPGKPGPLPTRIEEGDLAISANAMIPEHVLRPGLEMVVEIDPDGTLDPSLGIGGRIPESGRTALDVHALPTMELTLVPFLWTEDPDSSVLAKVRDMAANPEGHELLLYPRTFLPASDWDVTPHEPVWTDIQPLSDNSRELWSQVAAIRALESGRGYWMGTLLNWGGAAERPGWTSVASLDGVAIAHELGHNMSLGHAPCGSVVFHDGFFPDREGRIGAWGYDFITDELVPPRTPDVMSYCTPAWIGDYHFTKALRYRLEEETESTLTPETRTLLLWGGDSDSAGPRLEPAFVVDAAPVLPESAGGYTLTGRDAGGRELFSLPFAMPEIADAEEAAGGFAYTLPIRSGWEALASVTLTAPDGRTDVLDGATERPMSIWHDRRGQVRAILRGDPVQPAQADGAIAGPTGAALDVWTSRGIPSSLTRRR